MVRANFLFSGQRLEDPPNLSQGITRDSEEQWIPRKSPRPLSRWFSFCWFLGCSLNPSGCLRAWVFAIHSPAAPHSWPIDLDLLLSSWKEKRSLGRSASHHPSSREDHGPAARANFGVHGESRRVPKELLVKPKDAPQKEKAFGERISELIEAPRRVEAKLSPGELTKDPTQRYRPSWPQSLVQSSLDLVGCGGTAKK